MANLRANKLTGTEFFETTGSVQFDGSGDFLSVQGSGNDYNFGTNDFTVEFWVYVSATKNYHLLVDFRKDASTDVAPMLYLVNEVPTFYTVGGDRITGSSTLSISTWHHIALVRNSGTSKLYVNGIQSGSTYTDNNNYVEKSGRPIIGAEGVSLGNNSTNGHISNLRVLKGTALYTKNFTPPTRELTVIPNTVLLCCQSTTRANEEKTGKTITVNGNAVANELTPGLLTDRVKSGGSSSISGSVEFDGSSRLSISSTPDLDLVGDFTIEGWFYRQTDKSTYPSIWNTSAIGSFSAETTLSFNVSSSNILDFYADSVRIVSTSTVSTNSWNHFSVTRTGSTTRMFLNGILQESSTTSYTVRTGQNHYLGDRPAGAFNLNYPFNGHISNFRIIKGTALYTQNFIPPTRELKNLPGTVLLCCQNSKSATQEATGKTITVNGNATARGFTPPVGFDGFVNFDGATKIKSQNYFYLPTGTTEDRGRGRGLFGGGYVPGTSQNTIQFINIQSSGIAQDFGDLSSNMGSADGKAPCAAASATRALFASGYSAPGPVNTIEYVTISTTSNSTDFGDLTTNRRDLGACSSSTRALFGGGTTTGSTSSTNVIEYTTIASLGNTVSFGTLTQARRGLGSCSSSTRGIFGGGYVSNSPATRTNRIDYVTIATTGNATTFGDLTVVRGGTTSCSSSTRGIFAGGSIYVAPASTFYNTIDYITISSTGNATDFGDLSSTRAYGASCSNSIRGVFGGGYSPSHTNTIDFVLISSTGNATDFGDLLSAALYYNGGCSDSHGGLG